MFFSNVTFIRHGACPRCGSRDNLGTWSDGGQWCFGCGYLKPGAKDFNYAVDWNNHKKKAPTEKAKINYLSLPEDASEFLPTAPYEWLEQYELTEAQEKKLHPLYSYGADAMILPVYDSYGQLLVYQTRYFGDKVDFPKYLTHGMRANLIVPIDEYYGECLEDNSIEVGELLPNIVVVEDLISSVKVWSTQPCMPLLGSQLSDELALRLSKLFRNLTIWLDHDKLVEALEMYEEYKFLFDEVRVVNSPKDPKEYDTLEIDKWIHGK